MLKALVTVEIQVPSDLSLSLGYSDHGKYEIDILFSPRLVRNDTIVIEITNKGKIQAPLSCSNI